MMPHLRQFGIGRLRTKLGKVERKRGKIQFYAYNKLGVPTLCTNLMLTA